MSDKKFCDDHCTWRDHHPDCFMGPVAWLRQRDNALALSDGGVFGDDWMPLDYAKPPRKPLTVEDLRKLADKHLFYQPEGYEVSGIYDFARAAIEAAHGIKEKV